MADTVYTDEERKRSVFYPVSIIIYNTYNNMLIYEQSGDFVGLSMMRYRIQKWRMKVPAGYEKNHEEYLTTDTYCDVYISLTKAA